MVGQRKKQPLQNVINRRNVKKTTILNVCVRIYE